MNCNERARRATRGFGTDVKNSSDFCFCRSLYCKIQANHSMVCIRDTITGPISPQQSRQQSHRASSRHVTTRLSAPRNQPSLPKSTRLAPMDKMRMQRAGHGTRHARMSETLNSRGCNILNCPAGLTHWKMQSWRARWRRHHKM